MRTWLLAMVAGIAVFTAAPAYAIEAGDWMVRGRLLGVLPDESADVTPLGGSVEINNQYVPEVDLTYFITDHVGVEVIAAVTPHKVHHTPTGIDLGKVTLLPPTVTLQYHFNPKGKVKPYVGAGINYTHFFNEDAPGGTVTDVDYKDTWGLALQAGVDIQMSEHWYTNIDVKKIDISPDVSINGGAITANANIDPWVVGVGVGYKF